MNEKRFTPPRNEAEVRARLAALDALDDCARYARMVLKAWKAATK